jgi:hypothetical protein
MILLDAPCAVRVRFGCAGRDGRGKLHQVAGLIKTAQRANEIEPASPPVPLRPPKGAPPPVGMVASKQMNGAPAKCTTVGLMNAPHGKSPADMRSTSYGPADVGALYPGPD